MSCWPIVDRKYMCFLPLVFLFLGLSHTFLCLSAFSLLFLLFAFIYWSFHISLCGLAVECWFCFWSHCLSLSVRALCEHLSEKFFIKKVIGTKKKFTLWRCFTLNWVKNLSHSVNVAWPCSFILCSMYRACNPQPSNSLPTHISSFWSAFSLKKKKKHRKKDDFWSNKLP